MQFSCAVWIAALTAAGVQAAGPVLGTTSAALTSDLVIASTGDAITARMTITVSGLVWASNLQYVYTLPKNGRYVRNSITLNGAPLSDADARVAIFDDSVRVSLSNFLPIATTNINLKIRAVGSIGQAVHHAGVVRGLGANKVPLRAPPTWIEDETAVAVVPALAMDTYIRTKNGTNDNNYGGAAQLDVETGDNRRGLLQFNFSGTSIPAGYEVVAAYLEVWPTVPSGAAITLRTHRMKATWTEGTQDGGDCTSGATWQTRNCVNRWTTDGGDYDASTSGSTTVDATTSFAMIDMRQAAAEWMAGTRTNQGFIVRASSATSDRSVLFPSREGQNGFDRPVRLVVVLAPRDAYLAMAVTAAQAEIVPHDVSTNIPSQRFVYTLRPSFDTASTGMNRFTVTMPTGFTPVRVDSVRAWTINLAQNNDATLASGEYEVWNLGSTIDVRFAPPVGPTTLDPRIELVFHAGTPSVPNPSGADFPASIDHDRRGFAPQSATFGDANGLPGDGNNWTVRSMTAAVTAVVVSPPDTSVAVGHDVHYSAIAIYNTGDSLEVGPFATWSVLPPELATAGAQPNVFTGQTIGIGAVSATFNSITSAPARLEVTPPPLVRIRILPPNASFPAGTTQNYEAYGIYENGDSLQVTSTASWSSSDSTIATVVAPGRIRGVRNGSATIVATLDGVFSPGAIADVTPAELVSLHVTPGDTTVALGLGVQMHAFGTYSDSSNVDLTSVVTWNVVPPGIVDIDADGYASSTAIGAATVTATLGVVTSNVASFRVTPPELVSIAVSPLNSTIAVGDGVQLRAIGTLTNGQSSDITTLVTWNDTPPGIVTIAPTGSAVGIRTGTASVTATQNGITSNPVSITVTPPIVAFVDSVVVTPAPVALPPSESLQLTATVYYDDGSNADRTSSALWASDAPAVASVDPGGLLQTWSSGVALVRATFAGVVSSPCSVQVDTTAMDSLTVAPVDTIAVLGSNLQYRATAHEGTSHYDVTDIAIWSTADSLVARASGGGAVATRGVGITSVEARIGSTVAAPARLQVDPAAPSGIVVIPSSTSVRIGRTKQLLAQAQYTDGSIVDVTSQAAWTSDAPTVLYVDAAGLGTALALGTAHVTATYVGFTSAPATVVVLPAVEVEALPAGNPTVPPGTPEALLLTVRCTNRYLDVRTLTALRTQITGPIPTVHLRLDDGDGIPEPAQDLEIGNGTPSGGSWTATGIAVPLAVGGSQTLFVTGDVSLTSAVHGSSADAGIAAIGDLFWQTATAVVADFPLASPGTVVVRDLVRQQIAFVPIAADTIVAGTTGHPVLEIQVPSNGGSADFLNAITIRQLGTGRPDLEIDRLMLQRGPAPWVDFSELVHTGGGAWAASDVHLDVPPAGRWLRIVADAALTSEVGRTLRFEVPLAALGFDSGRSGAVDSAWANPASLVLQSPHTLFVEQTGVVPSGIVLRGARDLPVLGLELRAFAAAVDTLVALRLRNVSTGPNDAVPNPNAEIVAASLWADRDASGSVSGADVLLESIVPGGGDTLQFGAHATLGVVLDTTPQRLLVTLTPDSTAVRDAERLAVRLSVPEDVTTAGDLALQLETSLQTTDPPVIDGQSSPGYAVRPVTSHILMPGGTEAVVLDLLLPANGLANDVLTRLRVENAGTATATDLTAIVLRRDDGDGVLDAGDVQVAVLTSQGDRIWETPALAVPLPAGAAPRYFVTIRPAAVTESGRTFQARVPQGGVTVASGNDGPIDAALDGGGPLVVAASNQVISVAGVVGDHTVPPDARDQVALSLEFLNTYAALRTLVALEVTLRGSAIDAEFDRWSLHADTNQNGSIDSGETALATATPAAGRVRFESFAFDLEPLQQERLLAASTLAPGRARDGSTINCVITDANAFEYATAAGTTSTAAEFEIDSNGIDTIDGLVARQIGNAAVVPQTLGGGETNVVGLDLVLPGNGFDADMLQALAIDFVPAPAGAEFGADVAAIRLWQEQDSDPTGAQFDSGQDILLRTLVPGAPLRFDALASPLPVGGRRFYVTVDIAANPTDARTLQFRLPVGAVEVASGNDGPIDVAIDGATIHRTSTGALLATAAVQPLQVSRGESVEVRIAARNRGSLQLDGVVPLQLAATPPIPFQVESGPQPAALTLAPGVTDTLSYHLHFDAAGTTSLTVLIGTADSSVVAPLATSSNIAIQEPPSGTTLTMVSSMPALVNRGQADVVPIVWKLSHPDAGATAAAIAVRRLRLRVEDQAGTPQPAAAVLASYEVQSGTTIYGGSQTPPASADLEIVLTTPIVLQPQEERSVSLRVAIAAGASATSFRLRLVDASAVEAVDVNSEAPLAVQGTFPWVSQAAALRTPAAFVDGDVTGLLPARTNRGQTNVPVGSVTFTVPGSPGESEVRLTQLALAVHDLDGGALEPRDVLARLEIRSNTTVLLTTTQFELQSGLLQLPLTIPKTLISGAPEPVDIVVDLRSDASEDSLQVELVSAADVVLRDAGSGALVPLRLAPTVQLPQVLGRTVVESPAASAIVQIDSRTPASSSPGVTAVAVAALQLQHVDPAGSAAQRLSELVLRVVDDAGSGLVPRTVVNAIRVRQGSTVVATAPTIPDAGASISIPWSTPADLTPGTTLALTLEADLADPLTHNWIRFAFEPDAFRIADVNDASRSIVPTGSLPFATGLVHVLAAPSQVALGVRGDPPANVPRGATDVAALTLQIRHPGNSNETAIAPARLVVRLRAATEEPIAATAVAAAARLVTTAGSFAATLGGDSLAFDLSSLPSLAPGATTDLLLQLDVQSQPALDDFRFALQAEDLVATGGSVPIATVGMGGLALPWMSPTVHLAAADLESSFSNYPNPFVAGREATRITFYLPAAAQVTAEVYTLAGDRVVRLLESQSLPAGLHDTLRWDGRNGDGQWVRNGTYLLRLQVDGAGGGKFLRKLAVLR